MRPAFVVEIITPKGVILNGLWFGPKKPKRVIVWIHGLASSAFSMSHVVSELTSKDTAVLTFNNRGFETITDVKKMAGTKTKRLLTGTAHEVFTDSPDDVAGAINFVRKSGVKNVYLGGHSTGCQKSIYYAYKTKARGVKGIILLAPISDYAAEVHLHGKEKIARAMSAAHALISRGKKHSLLPEGLWHQTLDAQRFVSLCSLSSAEELFPYAQPNKRPRELKGVRIPILVVLAENDEYSDRNVIELAEWFDKNISSKHTVVVVPTVGHSFRGGEKIVAKAIHDFVVR